MHRLFFVSLLLSSFATFTQAQDNTYDEKAITLQLGASGGTMNCITDLGGEKKIFKTMKAQGGFYIGAMYHRSVGLRAEITWGSVTASDANADEEGVRQRNLSFSSDIAEASLLAEIHPLNLSPNYTFPISPYLVAGIGAFSFNPKTKLNGVDVLLQPLHTEGQGFPETGRPDYKLTQVMFPIGGGISYQVSPLLTIKGEAIYRVLKTDYLDDVSTTYIDPALFDKYLAPPVAATAKQLYYRGGEISLGSAPSQSISRGSSAKDAYYSVNIKLEFNF